ncbi:phage baseplate protein [Pseudomonas aeruginosa]
MATHALLLESGTVLFFDVVTDYSVQQQTQTTEHTLETGAVTSDHIIQQARQIQLNAILSDADFNYDRPTDTAIRQASAETGQDLSRTQVQTRLTGSTPKRLSLWSLLVTPA